MTVNELIEVLTKYPRNMRVLVPGYEGGYNDSGLKTEEIVFNFNHKDTWYYGSHECVKYTDSDTGTKCLVLFGEANDLDQFLSW